MPTIEERLAVLEEFQVGHDAGSLSALDVHNMLGLRAMATTAPADGQVVMWSDANGRYEPTSLFGEVSGSSSSVTLTATGTRVDIPGCTVDLPAAGDYIIVAHFDFLLSAASVASNTLAGVGILTQSDDTEIDSPRGALVQWFDPGSLIAAHGMIRATVSQAWAYTATAAETLKLRAYALRAAGTFSLLVNQTHTTIETAGFPVGGTGRSHDGLTDVSEDDHHDAFVGLEGDGSPVAPAVDDNRINLIAGPNVTLTPGSNAITIAASGGAGAPHELFSSTHPDTDFLTAVAAGDIIIRNTSNLWDNLAYRGVGQGEARVLGGTPIGGGRPDWITMGVLAALLHHGSLIGLTDDDHPQYANQTNTEIISGVWTWENFVEYAAVSLPSAPAEGHVRVALVVDGANLVLRGIGPTGATCDLCSWANVAVAHVNTLALNWMED